MRAAPLGDGRIEIYDHARYFTVTGNHWDGQMLDVEGHQADLDWLLALSPHGREKVPFTWRAPPPRVASMTRCPASPARCGLADANIPRSGLHCLR